MLELHLGPMTVCPTILYDKDSMVLVDTGMPGSAPAIRELIRQAGVGEIPLSSIILTHQDIDHIGGLPEFVPVEGQAPIVYAHKDDADAINGTEPMLKVTPERLASFLQPLPETVRMLFERTFLHPSRPNVDRLLADGEILPIAGGLTVIHTPGHTPGHVCLYHQPSKTLIAGDAMLAMDGKLKGPNPSATPHMEQALQSLKKLIAFDIETVICYHGGRIQGDVTHQIAALAGQL